MQTYDLDLQEWTTEALPGSITYSWKFHYFQTSQRQRAAKKWEEQKALSRGILPGRWQDRYSFNTILICFADQKGEIPAFSINKILQDWEFYFKSYQLNSPPLSTHACIFHVQNIS